MWSDYPCKIWTGPKNSKGYPHIWRDEKSVYVTRIVLEEKLGHPIPEGYEACHYCDEPSCTEVEHLWLGTHHRNMLDASKKNRIVSGWSAANAAKTHCPRGHEYTKENTYIRHYKRHCKECRRIWNREHYVKKG